MLNRFVRIFGGDPNKREIERYTQIVEQVNSLEKPYEQLSDEALRAKTGEFRLRLVQGETMGDILPEAFAAVREASKRTIGLRHYDVQLVGGAILHKGSITEMRTGEGKTLVATMPLYLNSLSLNPLWVEQAQRKWGEDPSTWSFEALDGLPVGRGTHLVTVNDYLARRDARWMGPIYNLLGLSVGVLQMAARTESGKKAFLVDLERSSTHEDQHQLRMLPRGEVYAADIVYGTNSEFGFDYLRDNMTMSLAERVQRGYYYAIVDEVDNILIDEARTPLIISGPAEDNTEWYIRMSQVVRQLKAEDYEVSEKDHTVSQTEIGEVHVEQVLGIPLRDPERPEDVTPEQARLLGFLEQALRAQHLFHRNKEYIVQAGKVVIVDEFTGRLMPGRRWSDGLHQAVEAKEGVRVEADNITYGTITIQNYFRMYEKLAGMTGTAATESEEFSKIYKLEVVSLPTNLEYQAIRPDSELVLLDARDESGYKYAYYANKEDTNQAPVFWKRKDFPDIVYRTEETKLRAIAREILRYHVQGRPILVGTTSVELSERVSNRLRTEMLRRLAQVLLLRNKWFEQNNVDEQEGRQMSALEYLNPPLETLPQADMRKMGRELGISLNPEDPANLQRMVSILGLEPSNAARLEGALKAGIPHQVLNARKHTEESQIIAGAGAFGAVTIATNMAGRGVDIKLGGDVAEEVLAAVARVLRRAGYSDPYDMSLQERRQALLKLTPDDYGIYATEINFYLQYMDDMQQVKTLGGLHVIGSVRHEARRIDNQLRGRSARQGDPGSSRFYLSMEDELMRLFGGQQADAMMQRLKIDDAVPLEFGLVGRLIEQAQTRVEGNNFDVRKHLLEYDDVLNSQRSQIYRMRDRIFVKDDLSEDVTDMLGKEVLKRVPEALGDEEGPWKLLSWLETIQPTMILGRIIFPSYTLKLLLENITAGLPVVEARRFLLETAQNALQAEANHLLAGVQNLLAASQERLQSQLEEHAETVDTYLSGLGSEPEEAPRNMRQVLDELSGLVNVNIRLNPTQQRQLEQEPDELRPVIHEQVETALLSQTIRRLLGALVLRLGEQPNLNPEQLLAQDWDTITATVLDVVTSAVEERQRRYLDAESGLIVRDLDSNLEHADGSVNEAQLYQLMLQMSVGVRTSFDRRTHRRVSQRTSRLSYIYYAAHLLGQRDTKDIAEDVLEHLEHAQRAIQQAWGVQEVQRLANNTLLELGERAYSGMQTALDDLDESDLARAASQPIRALQPPVLERVIMELGRQALTEVYRQLLLRVISGEWVEYLTQVEALRVAIGVESYGQDPLVQYKLRATDLFDALQDNIRLGVVSRMFTFRPQEISTAQVSVNRSEVVPLLSELPEAAEAPEQDEEQTEEERKTPQEERPARKAVFEPTASRSARRRRHRRR